MLIDEGYCYISLFFCWFLFLTVLYRVSLGTCIKDKWMAGGAVTRSLPACLPAWEKILQNAKKTEITSSNIEQSSRFTGLATYVRTNQMVAGCKILAVNWMIESAVREEKIFKWRSEISRLTGWEIRQSNWDNVYVRIAIQVKAIRSPHVCCNFLTFTLNVRDLRNIPTGSRTRPPESEWRSLYFLTFQPVLTDFKITVYVYTFFFT